VNDYQGYESTATLPSLIQILNGEPPANSEPVVVDRTPGGEFLYSNGGYVILQQALIDVANLPFQQIIDEAIFEPLGMTHSTFEQPLQPGSAANASFGHGANGNVMPGNYHIFPELAPAGLWTTPNDLALLLIELQLSLQGQSNKVLNEHLVEEMIPSIEGGGYGLGFRIWPMGYEIYFGHDGLNPGFVSMMIAHKSSGNGAVVMTNGDNGNGFIKRILRIIGKTENWPGY
jgi:CubicO group peptidase (beta-lactamase class C family)